MPVDQLLPNPLAQMNRQALDQVQQQEQSFKPVVRPADTSGPGLTDQIKQLSQKAAANPRDVPGAFQGPSQDMIKVLGIMQNYHEVKRATAQQKLAEVSNQARAGFMPDPKYMTKLMKQAGMHVDTSPEGIAAATNYFNQYYGENDPVTGASRGETPKEIQAMIEKANAGSLNKKDLTNFVMQGMIRNDLRAERYAAYNDVQKAALQNRGLDLLNSFTDDTLPPDKRADTLGKLAVLFPDTIGQMAKHWLDYTAATPEQRANQVAIASGMSSPKEIIARADNLTNDAISWGMSPDLARQYGDAVANGKAVPAAVQAAMPTVTSATLQTDAALLKSLVEAGIPGNMLPNALAAYKMKGMAGITNMLPQQTPVQIQQDLQKRMADLEQQRVGLEERRVKVLEGEQGALNAERMAAAAQREALAKRGIIAGDDAATKTLTDMIGVFSKIKNPDANVKALMDATEKALAPMLGGQLVTKPGWFSNEVAFQANQGLANNDVTGPEQKGAPPKESKFSDNTPGGQPESQDQRNVRMLQGITMPGMP